MKSSFLFSSLGTLMIAAASLFSMVVKYHYYAMIPIPEESWHFWIIGNLLVFVCILRVLEMAESFDYHNAGDEILLDPHEVDISE